MKKVTILPLLFGFCLYCQAQELEFSIAANSKKAVTFNKKLKPLLNQKSVSLLEEYFEKNKNDINDASVVVEYDGEFVKNAKRNKPLIHDVMDECIAGNYDTAMLSYIISKGANTAIDFFEWPPFYRALNFIATHKIEECKNAINVIHVFANSSNYDIRKQYKTELPPFAYLIRKNFEFLGNKYSKDYLPVELVKLFIDKGSNANTYDQIGNNLITFTVQTNNIELQRYLAIKDVDINKTNHAGKDAMYSAIISEATESVKELINTGYKLEPSRLLEMGLQNKINKTNTVLLNCITDESYKYVTSYTQAKDFMLLFDESKNKLLENSKYLQIGINNENIPEFISILEFNTPSFANSEMAEIKNIKTQYINGGNDLGSVMSAIQKFPLLKINNYNINYFTSEVTTKKLIEEINGESKILSKSTQGLLINEINANRNRYYSLNKEYDRWINCDADKYTNLAQLKFQLPSNVSQIKFCEQLVTYLKVLETSTFTILGFQHSKIVTKIYGWGIKENTAIISVQWYRPGVMPDKEWGSSISINTGFSAFSDRMTTYLNSNNCKAIDIKYMGSTAFDDEKNRQREYAQQKNCDECVMDIKNSTFPSTEEKWHLIGGTYTAQKNGKIKMENRKEYEWQIKDNGKFVMIGGFFTEREIKTFNSFETMINYFIEECRRINCR